jgi:hypothetical protein
MIKLSIISAEYRREKQMKEREIAKAIEEAEARERAALAALREQQREQRIEKLVEIIFEETKKQMDNCKYYNTHCQVLFLCSQVQEIKEQVEKSKRYSFWSFSQEWEEAMKIVEELLKGAGYRIGEHDSWYEYSSSWQDRSNKYGYFLVRW